MGRSKHYSKAVAEQICEAIATTYKSIDSICNQNDKFPTPRTFYRWLEDDTNVELRREYNLARERQADKLIAEMMEITDNTEFDTIINNKTGAESVNTEWITRAKLLVESRKWLASKLAPKKYGDKVDIITPDDKVVTISMDMGN